MTTRLLEIYLNDHLAGAVGGRELARRLSRALRDDPKAPDLVRIAAEIEEDRAALVGLMRALGVRINPIKPALGWFGEKLGRLKFNDRVLSRSPLSTVLELELLRLGVEGKAAAWRTLYSICEREPALDREKLQTLLDRAGQQIEQLEKLRKGAATDVFG